MGLLVLIAATLAVGGPIFRVETFDGHAAEGVLAELNDQSLVFDIAHGPFKLADKGGARPGPINKFADVRFIEAVPKSPTDPSQYTSADAEKPKAPLAPTVIVETLDGSRLPGFSFEAAKGIAQVKLDTGDSVELPTKFLRRVEFRPEGKPATWPELPKDAAGDLIVVQKKEAADLVEGVAGDVTADTVKFSVEGDVVPVKRAKVIGLVFFHLQQENVLEPTKVIVDASADWRLHGTHVALADGKLVTTTTFGAKIARPLDSISRIDFSPSRMDYLSDLPVDNVEWTLFMHDLAVKSEAVSRFYKPRFDRGLDGGPLMIGGTKYQKGVAIAARTVLDYKIAGRGRQFRARAGIDDSVHGGGSVKLSIEGDGKSLYSGEISGRGSPVDLNLDVSGVKRLRIIADFGGGTKVGDYLDLGDARIVR